jgi:hypothetical protein
MAGDWIQMRVALQTHPKVVRIASALKADRLRVVGGLHWSSSMKPRPSILARTSGSCRALRTSAFRGSKMEVGVPAFADTPSQLAAAPAGSRAL